MTGCPLENDGRLVFFVVDCNQPGFRLEDGAHFTALEGTGTLACQFRDCLISDHRVLAHAEDSEAYLAKIKPGMMLAQMGMGLGLISSCIDLIDSVSSTQASINQYLDDQADDLLQVLAPAHRETYRLAALLDNDPNAQVMPDVLKVRLAGGELSLRAAQAAMLHQGAKGYLAHSAAQRKLREAYFVAIVTPAIKHLRRELACLAHHALRQQPLNTPLLQVNNLSKSYQGNRPVFANIDFDVKAHEVVCLLGASGCGKSSLLKALAGLHPVNGGEILFNGKPLHKPDARIGLVFQDPCLLPWLTVQQNTAFPLTLHCESKSAGLTSRRRRTRHCNGSGYRILPTLIPISYRAAWRNEPHWQEPWSKIPTCC